MKLKYVPVGPCEWLIDRNINHAKTLGLPPVGKRRGTLYVVAGGPSINERVEVLQSVDGEIWAVNGAFQWCRKHGIDAVFFSVDSNPSLVDLVTGAKRAILATMVDPAVFEALGGAKVEVFDTGLIAGVHTGPTSVTSIPALAIDAGFSRVVFFGCEGSYRGGATHAYADCGDNPYRSVVECGGQRFATEAEYQMQCKYLSDIIRAAPHVFAERSGGLLRAMIDHGEPDVVWASPELMKILEAA